jgi:hypothetical protein
MPLQRIGAGQAVVAGELHRGLDRFDRVLGSDSLEQPALDGARRAPGVGVRRCVGHQAAVAVVGGAVQVKPRRAKKDKHNPQTSAGHWTCCGSSSAAVWVTHSKRLSMCGASDVQRAMQASWRQEHWPANTFGP